MSHSPMSYGYLDNYEQELFVLEDKDHRDDPTTCEEAISDIDSSRWLETRKSRVDSRCSNQESS